MVFSCVCVGLGGVLLLALPLLPLPPGGKVALLAVSAVLPPITFALGPAVLGEIVPDAQPQRAHRHQHCGLHQRRCRRAGGDGKLVQAQSHAGAAHGASNSASAYAAR